MFMAASFLGAQFVKPVFANRMEAIFKTDVNKVLMIFMIVHITIVCSMMKRVVNETYKANRDFFWQLAISKKAECICMILQKIAWYYYYIIVLLVLFDSNMMGTGLFLFMATLLYVINFVIHCRTLSKMSWFRKEICKGRFLWINKKVNLNVVKAHPIAELLFFSVSDLYKCMPLTAVKAAVVILFIYLGEIHALNEKIFLFMETALILQNDGYWRKESCNFPYFSILGISVGKYLLIHIVAGICFNTIIPLLIFVVYTGKVTAAVLVLGASVFLIVFWYVTQVYLYLTLDREKELIITHCSLLFLILGLVPVINIAVAVLIYKKITYKWRRIYAVG